MLKNILKEYRAKHNMNQGDLAQFIHVRQETIRHLERGNYNSSLKLA